MPDERALVFSCRQQQLVGILHPAPAQLGFLIVSGAPQYRIGSHRQFVQLARFLAGQGYPVFRFDYRGLGDSSGPRPNPTELGPDIDAALQQFQQQQPQLKQFGLIGLCDGATAALAAAADPRLSHLVLLNLWLPDPTARSQAYLKHYYRARLGSAELWRKLLTGKLELRSRLREYWLHRRHSQTTGPVNSLADQLAAHLHRFEGKTLIALSERDLTAQIFRELLQKPNWQAAIAQRQVRIDTLTGADHTLSQWRHQQQFFALLIEWITS